MKVFTTRDGNKTGEWTLEELQAALDRGEVLPTDLVWATGWEKRWRVLNTVADKLGVRVELPDPTPPPIQTPTPTPTPTPDNPATETETQSPQQTSPNIVTSQSVPDKLPDDVDTPQPTPPPPKPTPTPTPTPTPLPDSPIEKPIIAGFWRRGAALVVDLFLLAVANALLVALFGDNQDTLLLQTFLFVLYFTVAHASSWQSTLGKRLFNIKVTDREGNAITLGRSFGRTLVSTFSLILFGIGHLASLMSKKRRAAHDVACGTLVVNTEAIPEEVRSGTKTMPIGAKSVATVLSAFSIAMLATGYQIINTDVEGQTTKILSKRQSITAATTTDAPLENPSTQATETGLPTLAEFVDQWNKLSGRFEQWPRDKDKLSIDGIVMIYTESSPQSLTRVDLNLYRITSRSDIDLLTDKYVMAIRSISPGLTPTEARHIAATTFNGRSNVKLQTIGRSISRYGVEYSCTEFMHLSCSAENVQ